MTSETITIPVIPGKPPTGLSLRYPKAAWVTLERAARTHYTLTGVQPKRAFELPEAWYLEMEPQS